MKTATNHTLASLAACEFSLYVPHKIGCRVLKIKQMIIHSNLSEMKNKILPTCLQGNYRDGLGEFSNMSFSAFGAEGV